MIARVAVDGLIYAIDKPYSYLLPETLSAGKPGCRVSIPFGAGNRLREGIILSVEEGPEEGLKAHPPPSNCAFDAPAPAASSKKTCEPESG